MPLKAMFIGWGALALTAVTLAGCVEKVKPEQAEANAPSGAMTGPAGPAMTGGTGGMAPDGNTPRMGGSPPRMGGAPPGPGGGAALSAETKAFGIKVEAVKAQLAKKPADPALKKQVAEALYKQGESIMYDDNLPPRQKYGPALKLFNQALKYDPTHKGAAADKASIEGIYKSMGRPIPQ